MPMLNHLTGIIESGKLAGDVRLARDTTFSIRDWMNGSYQQQKEAYLNDSTGFRPDLVRLNNELDYRLFRKLHARDVVIGKNGYLYEGGYIRAYNGEDFLGNAEISSRLSKLRYIQDTLAKAGKFFAFVLVPSKGRYYPEYFPAGMYHPTDSTNYTVMRNKCAAMGINYLDLNGYFLSLKASTPHPLFSKQGIHWTYYGSDFGADSLNHYLEKSMKIDIPDMHFGEVTCTPLAEGSDNDIAQGLNLIWPFSREEFCYNQHSFDNDAANKKKPSIIFISDSFFWAFIHEGIPTNCYKDWECWFYFNEIWDQDAISGTGPIRYIKDTDWTANISKSNAVLLFLTECNLAVLGNGFIEEAYAKYGGK